MIVKKKVIVFNHLVENDDFFLEIPTIESEERIKLLASGFVGHTELCGGLHAARLLTPGVEKCHQVFFQHIYMLEVKVYIYTTKCLYIYAFFRSLLDFQKIDATFVSMKI